MRSTPLGGVVTLVLMAMLAGAADTKSPYAGERDRPIKALGTDEQADLLEGKGMGFAKAAELNGYPGPRHVLELAESLHLSAEQRLDTQALFDRMRDEARRQGAALIEAERALDTLYASRTATHERVERQLARIERVRVRLRAAHLQAHLDQAALLTPAQLREYSRLRGYAPTGAGSDQQHKGH
jgi:Spy/CpxP family protein refolding chaperone